jgi:hypothetical protein
MRWPPATSYGAVRGSRSWVKRASP